MDTRSGAFAPSFETVEAHIRHSAESNEFLRDLRAQLWENRPLSERQVAAAGKLVMRAYRQRRLHPRTFDRLKQDFRVWGFAP